MTPTQKNEQIRAATTKVSDIEFLASRDEFNRFMKAIANQSDAIADEVLHGDMKPEERESKRQFRLGLLMVLGLPMSAKNSALKVLNNG